MSLKIDVFKIYNVLFCLFLIALPTSEAIKQISLYPLILLGFFIVFKNKIKIKLDFFSITLALYALFFALSSVINAEAKNMLDPLRSALFFIAIYTIGFEKINIKSLILSLFAGYFIAYVMGVYKIFFAGADLFELKSVGYVNTSAIFSLFMLIFSLGVFRLKLLGVELFGKIVSIFMIFITFSAIILSASRTCIYLLPLLFLLSLFVIFDLKLRKKDLLICAAILGVLALFTFVLTLLPHERISYKMSLGSTFLGTRINFFVAAFYAWLDNPFFGIGGENFIKIDNSIYFPNSPEPHAPHAHNVVLNLLATTGIFTTLAYISFEIFAFIKFARTYKKSCLAGCALLVVIFSNIASIVELTFHSENLLLTLFIFALGLNFKKEKA